MKKASKTPILAVSVALIGLVWFAAVSAYTILLELPWLCWGAVCCVALEILIAELYILLLRRNADGAGTESSAFGIIATLIYLPVIFLVNSIFVLVSFGGFNMLLLISNLVLTIAYIIALMWVESHISRLSAQLQSVEQKTAPSIDISKKLGALLAIAEDDEIRNRILKLKESVDYSSNISTASTTLKESQMAEKLDEIAQLMIGRASKVIIISKLGEAEMLWKLRSTASSVR